MNDRRPLSERLARLPSGRDLPPEVVARGPRERILLAMTELAAEHGYAKTTIEAIAKTARVALSTFYEHFEDKEACFLAAVEESVDAARQALAESVDPDLLWPDRIGAGLEVLLKMAVAEPERAKLCLVESQAAGGASLACYHAMLESAAPSLREGRRLNPDASRLPDGLEVAIAGGLAWLVHQRLASGRVEEIESLLPEMVQVTLSPYVGETEARRVAAEAEARRAGQPLQ